VSPGFSIDADGTGVLLTSSFGTVDTFVRTTPARPTVEELRAYTGSYVSEEAQASFVITLENESLLLKRRPDTTLRLAAIYPDAFSAPQIGTLIFRRDGSGDIVEMSVVRDRVWDLRFRHLPLAP
jgi:hypothetical protein